MRRMALTAYTYYFLYIISASKLGKGENPELNTASLTSSYKLIPGNRIYNNIYKAERLNSQQILLRLNLRFYNPKKHYSKLLFTNITSYILPLLIVYSYKVITCSTHNRINKNTQQNFIHLTKQRRYYSPMKALHPEWVTGFIDAEGCFSIAVKKKNDKLKLGWKVQLIFQMELHSCDEEILICIQVYFSGIGLIYPNKKRTSVRFELSSLKDLEILIKHLDRYPLITQKQADYILWKQAFEIVQQREHLIIKGLGEIVAKKATMNTGNLSEKLKIAFPNLIPAHRPVPLPVINKQIKPDWISGFIAGEGSFMVKIKANKSHSLGYQTQLEFKVSQHSRDEQLIKNFIEYFDCGYLRKNETRPLVDFKVTRFDDILCKIILFFKKYPVIGVKNEDFADLCKVAELMKVNKHLTEEGLDHIRQIKVFMNRGRKEEWKSNFYLEALFTFDREPLLGDLFNLVRRIINSGVFEPLDICGKLKGILRINLEILRIPEPTLSMVKAILPEVYIIGASLIGPSLAKDRTSNNELGLVNWILAKGRVNQGVIHTHNLWKGLPKDIFNGAVKPLYNTDYFPYIILVTKLRNIWYNLNRLSLHIFPHLVNLSRFTFFWRIVINIVRVPQVFVFYILLSNKKVFSLINLTINFLALAKINYKAKIVFRKDHINLKSLRSFNLFINLSPILINSHIIYCYGATNKLGRAYYSSLNNFYFKQGNKSKVNSLKDDNEDLKVEVCYDNAELAKSGIISENRRKAGVYRWTNKINGKIYIGSAVDLSRRFKNYFNETSYLRDSSMIINKALLKYGYYNFRLEILEYTTKEKALEIEQNYLDLLNRSGYPSYNIFKKAGSRLGHKLLEVTKAKLRIASLGENNPNFGKSHSKETRKKISEALTGEKNPNWGKPGNCAFKGKTHCDETKYKMRIKKLGKNNPNFGKFLSEEAKLKLSSIRGSAVEVYDTEINLKSCYSSLTKAAVALSCSRETISKFLESKELFKGRYLITKPSNNDNNKGDGNHPSSRSKKTSFLNKDLRFGKGGLIKFHLDIINLDIIKYFLAMLFKIKTILIEIYSWSSTIVEGSYNGDITIYDESVVENGIITKECNTKIGVTLPTTIRKILSVYRGYKKFGIAYGHRWLGQRKDHTTNIILPPQWIITWFVFKRLYIFLAKNEFTSTYIISFPRILTNYSVNLSLKKNYLRLTPRFRSNLFIKRWPSVITNCQTTYHNIIFIFGVYGVMNKLGRAYYSSVLLKSNKSIPLTDDQEEIKIAVCYDNVELAKSQIISDNLNKAGVYPLTNKLNGKFYVGSSVNLSNRFSVYFNKAYIEKNRDNMAINSALLKYGYSNFKLEIIEYINPEMAVEIEQYYLDLLNKSDWALSYNILKKVSRGVWKPTSEETKAKKSLAMSGVNNPNFGKARSKEIREKISKALKGRKISEVTKAKIREANMGEGNPNYGKLGIDHHNFGKAICEEHKLKVSYARGTPIEIYDIETEVKSFYPSTIKAGKALTCSKTTISKYASSKELFKGKYIITKISNNDVKKSGEELLLNPLSISSDSGFKVLQNAQLRKGFNHPKQPGRRKYHNSCNPLFIKNVNGNKLFGRVLGKCASILTNAADVVSTIRFYSTSKVDKLNEYCKKKHLNSGVGVGYVQQNTATVIIKKKIYNLLYDKNIYKLAYEMLNKESHNMILLTMEDLIGKRSQIKFEYLIIQPNWLKVHHDKFNYQRASLSWALEKIIAEIITQIKSKSYKFLKTIDLKKLAVPLAASQIGENNNYYTFISALDETFIKDIIVIKAIVIILEAIYEPSFNSRKYRSSFNHKSALRDVKIKLKGVTWYIKGDISKCLSVLDFNVLMSVLEEKVKDKRFTDLIRNALGYFRGGNESGSLFLEMKKKANVAYAKLENNNIKFLLFSILINIFLERFDLYVEKLVSEGGARHINLQQVFNQENKNTCFNMSSVKISYVRYEDTWILGVKGSFRDCVNILNGIKIFFKQELRIELSDDSVEIINTKLAKYVIFLGVRLNVSTTLCRTKCARIRLEAPINYIKDKLTKAGFLNNLKPEPKLTWTHYEKQTIIALYSSYYYSIINYYSFVSNRCQLDSWLIRVLNSSCLKLLASKYSLSSQRKTISKFGLVCGRNLINRPINLQRIISNNYILFRANIKRFNSNKIDVNKDFNFQAYIAGFIDAEGNFFIKVVKNSTYVTGYSIQLVFGLILHKKDSALIRLIQTELKGVGNISEAMVDRVHYLITSIKDLIILITLLDKNPLLTEKWADYLLFKQAWDMMVRKEHLTPEGLKKILSIKAAMNGNGLSDKLKKAFPDVISITRPTRDNDKHLIQLSKTYYVGYNLVKQEIYDSSWLIGFIEGEACFFIKFRESTSYKQGYQIMLRFQISQHIRDKVVLQNIVNYLNCGRYREVAKNNAGRFEVESLKIIIEKIIPFLDKYPLLGIKVKDYRDFKKAANLLKEGAHLTPEGVKKLKEIKLNMNRARNFE